jgi:hypothetical protein
MAQTSSCLLDGTAHVTNVAAVSDLASTAAALPLLLLPEHLCPLLARVQS